MGYGKLFEEENESVIERYDLCIERIKTFISGDTKILPPYLDYFKRTADFIMLMDEFYLKSKNGLTNLGLDELKDLNERCYKDILPENYEESYANPSYAEKMLTKDYGSILSFLYTEIRGMIVYAAEERLYDITVFAELFLEILCVFETGEVSQDEIKDIIYCFEKDYVERFADYRVREMLDPDLSFATDIIMNSDLSTTDYLYYYGEYIGENEIGLSKFFAGMSDEEVDDMARTYVNGYRDGFKIAGIDLSKKETVNIRYSIGQERMIKAAIEQFKEIGLTPVIYRSAVNRANRKGVVRSGYISSNANKQYDYDHRCDETLFLTKAYATRKLEVIKNAYEERKELAKVYAGPAVVETFGEKTFEPVNKPENNTLTDEQKEISVYITSKSSEIVNEYIPHSEYSFTIIAYPLPEIGENFEEIFKETVKVNNLDNEVYKEIQQHIIDELDSAEHVRVVGCGDNKTDMYVYLHELKNPEKESNFENCTADVNIPLGEVFTSPRLKGTKGVLHVSQVYLNELKYNDIMLTFEDGMITDMSCSNFNTSKENKAYIRENVLFNRDTLPIGEFAIGTNTTAYVMAKKYNILHKLPILIVEKMGPHFAVGDTCYSHCEDVTYRNPDGKELVAKENECSALRNTEPEKAYFNCHTDITIPYEEIGRICTVHADGTEVDIIRDGKFVLPGCELLNLPLCDM